MKYKVGDKVRINSLDWYNENKIDYETSHGANKIRSHVKCNGYSFLDIMSSYCGKELTVDIVEEDKNNISTYIMKETAIPFKFTEGMIEGFAYEPQEKMVNLENVCKWIEDNVDDDILVKCGSVIKCMGVNDFVSYFRKAMEKRIHYGNNR